MSGVVTSAQAPLRIAIAGAGIAGLSLAGVLSKELKDHVHVTVFERASTNRDEGYGLDLDVPAQEALKRAGVFERYWEVSRPRSDVMKWYDLNFNPQFIGFKPRILQKLLPGSFQPTPESLRAGLRQLFLDALSDRDAKVHYETPIVGLQPQEDGRLQVMVKGADGNDIAGSYDLVVDACGVHSPHRLKCVHDESGLSFANRVLIHGAIEDPEKKGLPQEVLDGLGQGTLMLMGQGYWVCMQRYHPDPSDGRSAFFYLVNHDKDGGVEEEMGLPQATSRAQGMLTGESLEKAKTWLKNDMRGAFHPKAIAIVEALDRVTVRSEFNHGKTTLLPESEALQNLVVIGDSLRNIGLGGGGQHAIADALELADLLKKSFKDSNDGVAVTMGDLREAMQKMLKRREEFHEQQNKSREFLMKRVPGKSPVIGIEDAFKMFPYGGAFAWLGSLMRKVSVAWHGWDEKRGGAGSPRPSHGASM